MANQCIFCLKRASTANNRSKSMRATKRKQYANIQTKKIDGVKTAVCTNCIRTIKKKTA